MLQRETLTSVTGQQGSSIRFSCPSCGGRIKVPPGQAGQHCRCPRCDAEVIAPGAALEDLPSGAPLDEDDFFSSVDPSPRQQTTRPVITLDDEFAAPLGPAEAPSLPEAELVKPPELVMDAQSAESPPVSVDRDEAIDLPLSIDDAPAALSPTDEDQRPAKGGSPTSEGGARDAPTRREASQSQEFGVNCGLCGTRIYATLEQVGQELTCPDCYSKIPIRAPRRSSKPTQAPPPPTDDDDMFRLSEPIELPQSDYVARASQTLTAGAATAGSAASGEPAEGKTTTAGAASSSNIIAEHARSVFAKAKAEIEEAARTNARLPERPFVTGIVSFLFETNAVTRLIVLTFMLQIVFGLLGQLGHFAAFLIIPMAFLFSLCFLWTAAVCYQAILQDTANGCDKIEQWPGVAFLDWMMDAFYVVNALFVSATPGVLLGIFLTCGGLPRPIVPLFAFATTFVLFPLVLLSMAEMGSPLSIASGAVWKSLLTARALWLRFYLISLGLAVLALAAATLSLAISGGALGFILSGLVAALVVAVSMVYFRVLGRMAWCLSELERQTAKAEKSSDTATDGRET